MTAGSADASTFGLERCSDAGVDRLVVVGEVDVATSPELRRALHAMIDDGLAPIVVDLSGLTFIDSSGLGVLVAANNSLRGQGDRAGIVLQNLSESIEKVFEITGLTDLFGRSNP